jgi:hypothetical protein
MIGEMVEQSEQLLKFMGGVKAVERRITITYESKVAFDRAVEFLLEASELNTVVAKGGRYCVFQFSDGILKLNYLK